MKNSSRKLPKKVVVSKFTYSLLTYTYHALCLTGLIWQICLISFNFFKFDVNRDIDVVIPEYVGRNDNEVIYVCFPNYDILDDESYLSFLIASDSDEYDIYMRNRLDVRRSRVMFMKASERFNVTKSRNLITRTPVNEIFLIGIQYCMMIGNLSKVEINSSVIPYQDSKFRISIGLPLPLFDMRRQIVVQAGQLLHTSDRIEIKRYSYTTDRLEAPYTDNCFSYLRYGVPDRFGAVIRCENMLSLKARYPKISNLKTIRRSSKYLNYEISFTDYDYDVNDTDCKSIYSKPDCFSLIHLTQSSQMHDDSYVRNILHIKRGQDSDPSFAIKSKPRIDKIDFVTYIFGALGTWIGFSFISINPISYIFKVGAAVVPSPNSKTHERTLMQLICVVNDNRRQIELLSKENYQFRNNIVDHKRQIDLLSIENIQLRKGHDDNNLLRNELRQFKDNCKHDFNFIRRQIAASNK